MVVTPTRDRRAERREATRGEILDAAWGLAAERGLAGWTLRDVAAQIGMRPPSLYWYFESKSAVYDAMFAEGNQALLDRMDSVEWPRDPRGALRRLATLFVEFSVEDPPRAQLLFQRTIPDFEPSPESYGLAVEALERGRAILSDVGIGEPAHFDLWTALVAGLASQQIANNPGGDRWRGLVDQAVEMYADHVFKPSSRRRSR